MSYTLTVTEPQLRLLWLVCETLVEANPDDPDALALDKQVTRLVIDTLDP